MTKALTEAIARRPPHGSGTTTSDPNRAVTKTSVTSASTAAIATGASANGTGIYITLVCSQDAHIRFGPAAVGAATTSDYLLRSGIAEEFWCEGNEDTHFRVIRDAVDGSLYHWRSGG